MALNTLGRNFVYEVSGLSFTTTLTRFNLALGEDIVGGGVFEDIAIHLTSIVTAANFAVLTLGWIDDENDYIVSKLTAQTFTTDIDTASNGDFTLNINKKFGPVPSTATGIWLGIDLDAGSATGRVELLGRTQR